MFSGDSKAPYITCFNRFVLEIVPTTKADLSHYYRKTTTTAQPVSQTSKSSVAKQVSSPAQDQQADLYTPAVAGYRYQPAAGKKTGSVTSEQGQPSAYAVTPPVVDLSKWFDMKKTDGKLVNKGLKRIPRIDQEVSTLNLSTNNIRAIREEDLTSIFRVTYKLDLSHNRISYISPRAFCNEEFDCEFSRLSNLILDHNRITAMPPLRLPKLVKLFIGHNQIKKLTPQAFEGFPRLYKLTLDHNSGLEICELFSYSLIPVGNSLTMLYIRDLDGTK